ncbi:hypothetical protein [Providencia rettgeri]|uniref:hypothetical protein n=1 Tax=Providencia rettgeri TaxID=587 RepID=UPI00065E4551|nr:hypothetical protein [Providencia rettgeri]
MKVNLNTPYFIVMFFLFTLLANIVNQIFNNDILVISIMLFVFILDSLFVKDPIRLLTILIIAFKGYFLISTYDPLSSIDAHNYYNMAFSGDNSGTSFFSMIINLISGDFSIVEMTSLSYQLVASIFGTHSVLVLVYANYIMIYLSAIMFLDILKYRGFNFSEFKASLFILFVVLSPLLSKYSTLLLKEAILLFLTILSIKSYVCWKNYFLFILLLLIATVIRPYTAIIILAYFIYLEIFSFKKSLILVFISFLAMCAYFYNAGISIIGYLKDIALSFAAIIAAPNFLRLDSWLLTPFLVLESLLTFTFICYSFYTYGIKGNKYLIVSIVLMSIILGAISYNRGSKIEQLSSIKSGSLLQDDIVRKKFGYQLLLLSLIIVGNKKRETDDY